MESDNKVENSNAEIKDHLFISYATEDQALADWVALRLSSEGYKIWYDRIKLLGGESYPTDITSAIKNRTYRLLFLESHSSLNKPNPMKEVTLALNVSRERNEEFVIPLKVDDLKPSDLNFLTSDLVYIPFNRGWYDGFALLLKKLSKIKAPKDTNFGRSAVSDWIQKEQKPASRKERIWSNLIDVEEIPKAIFRYSKEYDLDSSEFRDRWIVYVYDNELYSFEKPPNDFETEFADPEVIKLSILKNRDKKKFDIVVKSLIKKYLLKFCLTNGLEFGGVNNNILYFPSGLLEGDKLKYNNYNGRKTYVRVAGERQIRKFSQGFYLKEKTKYNLTLNFKLLPGEEDSFVVRIKTGLLITDEYSNPLPAKEANRKRKAICKDWWNKQWLSRIMSIASWLSNGEGSLTLLENELGKLMFNTNLQTYNANFGIKEGIVKDSEEDDSIIVEEYEEDDNTGIEEP
jgi:hypothetical protein